MPQSRPAPLPPWWRRYDRPDTRRSRRRLVVHVLLMTGLLVAMLAV